MGQQEVADFLKTKEGEWNYFKWWQVRSTKYIKDIETLILQLSQPKLNKIKGHLKKKYKIK